MLLLQLLLSDMHTICCISICSISASQAPLHSEEADHTNLICCQEEMQQNNVSLLFKFNLDFFIIPNSNCVHHPQRLFVAVWSSLIHLP